MVRVLILMIGISVVLFVSNAWSWTFVAHQGKHTEDGIEYEPVCPQDRKTKKAPDEFYNKKNPLEPTPENIFSGQTLFHFDVEPTPCRTCHGISGNGLGILFQKLSPGSRNFTCERTMRDIPDGQLFWVIRNGSAGTAMPAFKNLKDVQIWQLILYIRHFSGQGS